MVYDYLLQILDREKQKDYNYVLVVLHQWHFHLILVNKVMDNLGLLVVIKKKIIVKDLLLILMIWYASDTTGLITIDTGEGGTGCGKDVEQSKMSPMIQSDTRDEAINASDQVFHYGR